MTDKKKISVELTYAPELLDDLKKCHGNDATVSLLKIMASSAVEQIAKQLEIDANIQTDVKVQFVNTYDDQPIFLTMEQIKLLFLSQMPLDSEETSKYFYIISDVAGQFLVKSVFKEEIDDLILDLMSSGSGVFKEDNSKKLPRFIKLNSALGKRMIELSLENMRKSNGR